MRGADSGAAGPAIGNAALNSTIPMIRDMAGNTIQNT
jgi:hypothetical protein